MIRNVMVAPAGTIHIDIALPRSIQRSLTPPRLDSPRLRDRDSGSLFDARVFPLVNEFLKFARFLASAVDIPCASVADCGANRVARYTTLKDIRHAASGGTQPKAWRTRVPHKDLLGVGRTAKVAHAPGGEVDTSQVRVTPA
ncbi:hypothetical protein Y023_5266 [Burkholderia pseudomallei A79D]|nr:hypothetical protein X962_4085 [Burkholderia pseudomallei MSHR7343]KGS39416.1 hypothetical protein X992_5232 [Burkholderia pseudomallei MSHR5492]KGX95865.1 hypothetical protein Y023_5266 [Burkholderia pseudomallei A79D]KGX96914.1 hypothetical protein X997_4946 [Burkholderia pseudomallei A79C]